MFGSSAWKKPPKSFRAISLYCYERNSMGVVWLWLGFIFAPTGRRRLRHSLTPSLYFNAPGGLLIPRVTDFLYPPYSWSIQIIAKLFWHFYYNFLIFIHKIWKKMANLFLNVGTIVVCSSCLDSPRWICRSNVISYCFIRKLEALAETNLCI